MVHNDERIDEQAEAKREHSRSLAEAENLISELDYEVARLEGENKKLKAELDKLRDGNVPPSIRQQMINGYVPDWSIMDEMADKLAGRKNKLTLKSKTQELEESNND